MITRVNTPTVLVKSSITIRDKLLLTSDKIITKIEGAAHEKNVLHKIRSSIDKAAEPSINKDCYSLFEFV